jgi:hypothetical protein
MIHADRWMDEQTDMTNLTGTFPDYANAFKTACLLYFHSVYLYFVQRTHNSYNEVQSVSTGCVTHLTSPDSISPLIM